MRRRHSAAPRDVAGQGLGSRRQTSAAWQPQVPLHCRNVLVRQHVGEQVSDLQRGLRGLGLFSLTSLHTSDVWGQAVWVGCLAKAAAQAPSSIRSNIRSLVNTAALPSSPMPQPSASATMLQGVCYLTARTRCKTALPQAYLRQSEMRCVSTRLSQVNLKTRA